MSGIDITECDDEGQPLVDVYQPPGHYDVPDRRRYCCFVCGEYGGASGADAIISKKYGTWARHYAHRVCGVYYVEGARLVNIWPGILHKANTVDTMQKREASYTATIRANCIELANKKEKSATVFLLLRELGFPYDVAWPVAALIGWFC